MKERRTRTLHKLAGPPGSSPPPSGAPKPDEPRKALLAARVRNYPAQATPAPQAALNDSQSPLPGRRPATEPRPKPEPLRMAQDWHRLLSRAARNKRLPQIDPQLDVRVPLPAWS